MRLDRRMTVLEASSPTTLQPGRRIIGHSQEEIDRQLAELRAEGFDGMVICRLIVSPKEGRHAI